MSQVEVVSSGTEPAVISHRLTTRDVESIPIGKFKKSICNSNLSDISYSKNSFTLNKIITGYGSSISQCYLTFKKVVSHFSQEKLNRFATLSAKVISISYSISDLFAFRHGKFSEYVCRVG